LGGAAIMIYMALGSPEQIAGNYGLMHPNDPVSAQFHEASMLLIQPLNHVASLKVAD